MKITFIPENKSVDVDPQTKILIAAKRAQAFIRFGCGSARCGTCAVRVDPVGSANEIQKDERALLTRLKLPCDGTIRLACQARVMGDILVDIDFQDTYSPDDHDEYES